MTIENIVSNIKKKIYHPVYFLAGEETYYIDKISELIENSVLNDIEKEFNLNILYGRDIDTKTIVEYAKRFPMMSNYQVVIVREAQVLEKSIYELEELYLNKIQNSTILVICFNNKVLDGRRSLKKKLEKDFVYFESKKISEDKLSSWIINLVKEKKYDITVDAAQLLADYLGNDLHKIENEVNKLIISQPLNTTINTDLVEQNTGISKDFNIFELQKAIGKKDILKVNRIINYFASNPKENPMIKNLAMLFRYFNQLLTYHQIENKMDSKDVASKIGVHPYYINDYVKAAKYFSPNKLIEIISLLRHYDLISKGIIVSSANESDLMREMMFKILH